MAQSPGNNNAGGSLNVADLVREVRSSEQWIDLVETFYLRLSSQWMKSPEGVERVKAELRQLFPDTTIDEQSFPELRPRAWDTVEIAFDATRAMKACHVKDRNDAITVWDGRELLVGWKDLRTKKASYLRDKHYGDHLNNILTGDMGWPRAGKHDFWWYSRQARQENVVTAGEDFVLMGKQQFRGVECYVLMAPVPRSGNDQQWYVAVGDHRLRGMSRGCVPEQKLPQEVQHLAAIAKEEGVDANDVDSLQKWLDSLPSDKKERLLNRFRVQMFSLYEPHTLFLMDDYQEVAPGCYLPMSGGWISFATSAEGRPVETARREIRVSEVQINRPLDAALFSTVMKEEGASVLDTRGDDGLGGRQGKEHDTDSKR